MAWLRARWLRWVLTTYLCVGLTWGVWLDHHQSAEGKASDGWGGRALRVASVTIGWPLFAAVSQPFPDD